ncbi:MAG: NADH-quinone oxidoreductase subunit H [Actinobacteria bacterium]|nr:NADH-quinone oxidoreductase subunit H [Actinomycetota bacterium]MBU4483049.1 NADH-quinone oxidoreductase subunit H [Actinomycetota bacterium]
MNLYICEYIGNKLTARIELRRGYRITRIRGAGFPLIRFFKYLSRDNKINIWTFFIFLLSFLMWSAVPITANLVLIEMDYSLLVAITFYIGLIIILFFNSSRTSYSAIFSEASKKVLILLSFLAPVLFSIVSIVLISKTLSLKEIVNSQYQYWNIIFQPLGFITFFISLFLQLKLLGISRKSYLSTEIDIGKEGIGLGKIVEKISAYMIVLFLIIILNILYLGGWQNIYFIRGEIMLAVKFYFIFILLLLMDKTIGRIDSYKLLVRINWKFLIPVSLVNFIVTLGFFIARNEYSLI